MDDRRHGAPGFTAEQIRVKIDRMLHEGDLAAGRYRLQTLIGEGAMGEVWRAEDELLRRLVAVKFLFVQGARDPRSMVEQFLREARIAASVQHRNVIHTVDFGTVEDGKPYMVMELLDGLSLADRMEREPPLSIESFVQLVGLTLRGLSAVHDAGIVHRDLKPANIFLQNDPDGVLPKILDFGISRSLQGEERKSAIATQHGLIVGTPDYMAPEQARGETNVDKRADIYAMGAILYEGLTGHLPYEADNIGELIAAIVTTRPRPVRELRPEVPAPIAEVVDHAMAYQREDRFADARAMRSALMSAAAKGLPALRHLSVSGAPPPRTPEPIPPATARGRAGFGARSLDGGALDVPSPQAPREPVAASAGGGWGAFEGLPERPSLAAAPPSPPRAASARVPAPNSAVVPGSPPRPRPAGTASAMPASLVSGPPMEVPAAPSLASARPRPPQGQTGVDARDFRGAQIDSLGLAPSNDQSLEIDYQRGTEHAPRRKQRSGQAGSRVQRIRPTRRRKSSSWPAAVLLVLVLIALGLGPSAVLKVLGGQPEIGPPTPMESPEQRLQMERRRAPGRHTPALRDLLGD